MRLEPYPYQEHVIGRMLDQERLGLLLDPGLGKTGISVEALLRLWDSLDADRALVVAPLRPAYSVWPHEAKKWEQFERLRVQLLHGEGKTDSALRSDADLFVINPEGLPWLAAPVALARRPDRRRVKVLLRARRPSR